MRGLPLGIVHTASGEVTVAVGEPELEKEDFLQTGWPPTWVHDWGWDEFGLWAFRVGEIEPRMRRVPAGSFLMSSPEDEEGRADCIISQESQSLGFIWLSGQVESQHYTGINHQDFQSRSSSS